MINKNTFNSLEESKIIKFFGFVFLITITSFQTLSYILLDGEYIHIANETVAYRFFYAERSLLGEPITVGVGYLVGLIQQLVYLFVNHRITINAENLNIGINLFSNLTNLIILTMQCIVITITFFSKKIYYSQKIIILSLSLTMQYGFGFQEVYYSYMPDYLHLNMVIALWLVYVYIVNFNEVDSRELNSKVNFYLFALMGIALTNKITLLPLMALSMLPILFNKSENNKTKLTTLLSQLFLAIFLFVLTHFIFYLGSFDNLLAASKIWFRFVLSPGGDPSWTPSSDELKSLNVYFYSIIYFCAIFIFFIVNKIKYNKYSIFIIFNVLAVTFYVYAVYKRPASTTLFESTQWTLCIASMLIATSFTNKFRYFYCCLILLVSFITYPTFSRTISHFNTSKIYFKERKEFFDRGNFLSKNRKQIIILEDNSYHHEGIHELLIKGASDFPSWDITSGKKIIDKYLGNAEIRSKMSNQIEYDSIIEDNDSVVIYFQKPDEIDLPFKNRGVLEFSKQNNVVIEKFYFKNSQVVGLILYKSDSSLNRNALE